MVFVHTVVYDNWHTKDFTGIQSCIYICPKSSFRYQMHPEIFSPLFTSKSRKVAQEYVNKIIAECG